jgi:hypothetical protein
MTTIQFFRIDNQIVERLPGGFMVGPIKRYEKKHGGVKLDLDIVPYISFGTRGKDNMFLWKIMDLDNDIRWDDFPIIVPAPIQ